MLTINMRWPEPAMQVFRVRIRKDNMYYSYLKRDNGRNLSSVVIHVLKEQKGGHDYLLYE